MSNRAISRGTPGDTSEIRLTLDAVARFREIVSLTGSVDDRSDNSRPHTIRQTPATDSANITSSRDLVANGREESHDPAGARSMPARDGEVGQMLLYRYSAAGRVTLGSRELDRGHDPSMATEHVTKY